MARSRYFQTQTTQDLTKKDPRDLNKTEPQHYLTWNIPVDLAGYAPIDLLQSSPFTEHVWKLGDRLDRISNQLYGDDQYWWVIALVNGIDYPLAIRAGTVIRIPTNVNDVLQRLELI